MSFSTFGLIRDHIFLHMKFLKQKLTSNWKMGKWTDFKSYSEAIRSECHSEPEP